MLEIPSRKQSVSELLAGLAIWTFTTCGLKLIRSLEASSFPRD